MYYDTSIKNKVITKIGIITNSSYSNNKDIRITLNRDAKFILPKIFSENNENYYLGECNFSNTAEELALSMDIALGNRYITGDCINFPAYDSLNISRYCPRSDNEKIRYLINHNDYSVFLFVIEMGG